MRGLPAARQLLDRVPVTTERECLLLAGLRREFATGDAAAPFSALATTYLNVGLTAPALALLEQCPSRRDQARRERIIAASAGDAVEHGELRDVIRALGGGCVGCFLVLFVCLFLHVHGFAFDSTVTGIGLKTSADDGRQDT
jgi:hypothetical protein